MRPNVPLGNEQPRATCSAPHSRPSSNRRQGAVILLLLAEHAIGCRQHTLFGASCTAICQVHALDR
jgi:hypothetical protein